MFINIEETPNPNTLKFIPESEIKLDKTYIFNRDDDLQGNQFLETLFDIDGIKSVLIDKSFISITKLDSSVWEVLKTIITSTLGNYLDQNDNSLLLDKITKPKDIFNHLYLYKSY